MEIKIRTTKECHHFKMGCGDTLELTFGEGKDNKILFFFDKKGFFGRELGILLNPQKYQEFYTLYLKKNKTLNELLKIDSVKKTLFNYK